MGDSKSDGLSSRAWRLLAAGFTCVVASACAGLLPSTDPGTPGGGPYCNHVATGAEAECYPTETQRADAWHAKEAESDRATREAARLAAIAEEAERQERVRVDREQKMAEETASREESARKIAEFVAERDRKDAVVAATAAAVHQRALDKEYAGPAISAIMCSIDDEVRGLRADLAHEKRVTAVGGVVDLKARNDIASGLVDDAEELDGWRKALTRYGAARVPCKDVAGVDACHHGLAQCEGKTRDIAQIWLDELGTLWGSDQQRPNR